MLGLRSLLVYSAITAFGLLARSSAAASAASSVASVRLGVATDAGTLLVVTSNTTSNGTSTAASTEISSGDTAWLLISSALVSIMTPGLAFFYGGLVESTTVLNTLMMSYVCAALITVRYILKSIKSLYMSHSNESHFTADFSSYFALFAPTRAFCPDSICRVRLLVYVSRE